MKIMFPKTSASSLLERGFCALLFQFIVKFYLSNCRILAGGSLRVQISGCDLKWTVVMVVEWVDWVVLPKNSIIYD